jgi:hypothetical protein
MIGKCVDRRPVFQVPVAHRCVRVRDGEPSRIAFHDLERRTDYDLARLENA